MRKFIRKGFTLIEMAVVLVLLGILAALAVPTFSALITGTEDSTAEASAEAVMSDIRGLGALENATPKAYIEANTPITVATSEGDATVTNTTTVAGAGTATINLPGSAPDVVVTFADGYPTTFVAQ